MPDNEKVLISRCCVAAVIGISCAGLSRAAPLAEAALQPPTLSVEEVAEGLYVIASADGNGAARVTPKGVILVDGAPLAPGDGSLSPLPDLGDLTDQSVSHVVYTDHHRRPTVGPAWPPVVEILAQANARMRMVDEGLSEPPRIVFRSTASIFVDGIEVQLHHFGPGHTGGDAIAFFPDLHVVHTGDLVVDGPPFIDYEGGGSSHGWVSALGRLLTFDFTVAIPGEGHLLTRGDVQAFRDKLVTLRARVAQLIEDGVPRDDLARRLVTDDLGWPLEPNGLFVTRSLPGLYDELRGESSEGEGREPTPETTSAIR